MYRRKPTLTYMNRKFVYSRLTQHTLKKLIYTCVQLDQPRTNKVSRMTTVTPSTTATVTPTTTTTTMFEIIDKIKKRKKHVNRKKLERSIQINEELLKVIEAKDKVIKEQENQMTKCNPDNENKFEFRIPRINMCLIFQFWSAFIVMFSKNLPESVNILVSIIVICLLTNSE